MFLSKKTKNAVAFTMSLSILATAIVPVTASADSGTFTSRTKAEAYGDDTYGNRFMSLYDDVIANGVENGYLSEQNGNLLPYHCVETLNVEAPDYGHETTSEAMSYLVWIAAMRDNLAVNGIVDADKSSTLSSAWSDMAVMIPTVQTGFWDKASQGQLSATYNDEWDEPETYPTDMQFGNSGVNPIQSYFTQAYSSDKGLYLLHWLADVNDWYGYGGSTGGKEDGSFTFINTFQRGAQESCWETVPHPCVEELKYGNNRGIKGIFSTEGTIAQQWAYTNAPDAEDRAIQAVYAANRWGVGDSSVTTLAGKMGDELRNNFFDKYYKKISTTTTKNDPTTGYESSHYLRNWYTSWGGALDGSWAWQIGCSHVHEFYQNPLAAYALLADSKLNSAMKAQDATKDYQTSLARQLELYLWLQSSNGPIAGGATNSWRGRYESYPAGTSTFYEMAYVEHPVYEDPGSNHWIGNQVWALQRISELYYDVAQNGDKSGVTLSDGSTVEQATGRIMDKWVKWSIENIKFDQDAIDALTNYDKDQTTDGGADTTTWAIPVNLDWSGQPDTWNGSATDNTGLTCTITGYSRGVGESASWANGLIYYAAAKGVDTNTTKTADELIASSDMAEQALGVAKKILDYQWEDCRDEIGISVMDTNGSLKRMFEQSVWVPTAYGTGTMPDGSTVSNGATFLSIRQSYSSDPDFERLKADYDDDGDTSDTEFYYHRFWHQGDAMIANGTLATLFPSLTPPTTEGIKIEQDTIEVEVGETDKIIISEGTADSFTSADESIATVSPDGTVTGVAPGTTTITVTGTDGTTDTVTVIVTKPEPEETTTDTTTETTTETTADPNADILWGDVNCDGKVKSNDLLLLKKYLLGLSDVTPQGLLNADVTHDDKVKSNDLLKLKKYLLGLIEDLGPEA